MSKLKRIFNDLEKMYTENYEKIRGIWHELFIKMGP